MLPRWFKRSLAALSVVCFSSAPIAFGQVSTKPGDWPQWRGPNRDGISVEKGLLKEWPEKGPAQLWQVDTVGVGYSSLAVVGGKIYTQGDLGGVEHILCLDAKTGQTVWAVQPGPVAKLLADRTAKDFETADKDANGKVDELEALARFGWDFNKFDAPLAGDVAERAKARAAKVFAALDADKNGSLSFEEASKHFRQIFSKLDAVDRAADPMQLVAGRTAAIIKALDKDGDGKVSRKEAAGSSLDQVFGQADQKDPATNKGDDQLTSSEIETYYAKSESGRDGVVTLAELSDYYTKNKANGDGELTVAELRGSSGGYRNGMGDGPRGTPTVDGDRVYVEGGNGDLSCLKAATGETIWHLNLRNDFGGGLPGWGFSESPLIEKDWLIVTPGGGKGTIVVLNKMTGEKVWQSESLKDGAHYSSPLVANIAGTRQIVQFSNKRVVGVSLTDGKLLWSYAAPANGTANCCSPIVENEFVFASSAYGTGGGLARITGGGDSVSAEEIYFEKKMACHHGGIVKVGEYMYSNGGGALICMHFMTGKIAWQNRGVGKGALVVADDMLYLLSESHEVALVEVNPNEYVEKGRFKINSHGRPSWAHPVVADGKLLIRDQESLSAYNVRP